MAKRGYPELGREAHVILALRLRAAEDALVSAAAFAAIHLGSSHPITKSIRSIVNHKHDKPCPFGSALHQLGDDLYALGQQTRGTKHSIDRNWYLHGVPKAEYDANLDFDFLQAFAAAEADFDEYRNG